jgi:hypothetical protein
VPSYWREEKQQVKQWCGGARKDENAINQIEETSVRTDQWKQNRRK